MELGAGYTQSEVGPIPEDWNIGTAAEVCETIVDCKNRTPPVLDGGEYAVVRTPNVRSGKFVHDELRFTDEKSFREWTARAIPQIGDVLITREAPLGEVCLVPPDLRVCLGQRMMLYRPDPEKADRRFLLYALMSSGVQRNLLKKIGGSTVGHAKVDDIRNLQVPIPRDKDEQHAIADALSDADMLIDALEQLLTKKRNIKQGAMQELLTGKRRLPGFSGEWKKKALGALFDFGGGFTASRDQLSSNGYCYLHYGDIHTSKKTFVDIRAEYQDIPKLDTSLKEVSTASLLEDGDVVFVDASEDDEGTSKHVVIVNRDKIPFISGLHTIVAKSKTDELQHEYRRYCFQTSAVKAQFLFFAVGTKVSGISKTNISKVSLPVPSVPEQAAIAAILSSIDAETAALEKKLVKSRQVKQGMMQELLTGRIRLL